MKKVTVWHNGAVRHFPLISVKSEITEAKNGIKQKGFYNSSKCTLRIATESEIDFSIGDFVRFGEHTGDADRSEDFKLTGIYNNLRGTTPHYRLVCEK